MPSPITGSEIARQGTGVGQRGGVRREVDKEEKEEKEEEWRGISVRGCG